MGSRCSACGRAIQGREYLWDGKPYHASCLPLEITSIPGRLSEGLIREAGRDPEALWEVQEQVDRLMEGLGFTHYPYAQDLHPSYPFPYDWEKEAYGEDLVLVFMYCREGEGFNLLVRRSGELQLVPAKLSCVPG